MLYIEVPGDSSCMLLQQTLVWPFKCELGVAHLSYHSSARHSNVTLSGSEAICVIILPKHSAAGYIQLLTSNKLTVLMLLMLHVYHFYRNFTEKHFNICVCCIITVDLGSILKSESKTLKAHKVV